MPAGYGGSHLGAVSEGTSTHGPVPAAGERRDTVGT